jgi:hypothetical protein
MTNKTTKAVLVTEYIHPPIPLRHFDYCTFEKGEEESGFYGWGASKEDSIRDWMDNYNYHSYKISIDYA